MFLGLDKNYGGHLIGIVVALYGPIVSENIRVAAYSVRSACMGSIEAALRAGRTAASVTMTAARTTAPANVRGSEVVTP